MSPEFLAPETTLYFTDVIADDDSEPNPVYFLVITKMTQNQAGMAVPSEAKISLPLGYRLSAAASYDTMKVVIPGAVSDYPETVYPETVDVPLLDRPVESQKLLDTENLQKLLESYARSQEYRNPESFAEEQIALLSADPSGRDGPQDEGVGFYL